MYHLINGKYKTIMDDKFTTNDFFEMPMAFYLLATNGTNLVCELSEANFHEHITRKCAALQHFAKFRAIRG